MGSTTKFSARSVTDIFCNYQICAFVSVLLFGMSSQAFSALDFTPRLEVSQTYSDNIELARRDKESEHVTQFNPGFSVSNLNSRYQFDIEYALENLYFWNDNDRNDSFHQLDAVADLEVLKERFFIDANANSSQALIDPEQTFATSTIESTGNVTDQFIWRISPYWVENLGSFAISTFRFGYSVVDVDEERADGALVNTRDDSERTERSASLRSFDPEDRLVWQLGYRKDKVNFDDNPTVEAERYQLDLDWRISRSITLLGVGGYEDNDFASTLDDRGDLDGDFWETGIRYQVSPRNQLEARYGERFFGNTRLFSWNYVGRRLDMQLQYNEELTTDNLEQEFRGIDEPPVELDDIETDLGRRDFEAFESDRFDALITYELSKSVFTLVMFDEDQKFQQSQLEDESRGVEFNWDWRFRPRTTFLFEFLWDEEKFQNIGAPEVENDTYEISFGLDYEISPRLTFNTIYAYSEQESDDNVNEFEANEVSVGLTYELIR